MFGKKYNRDKDVSLRFQFLKPEGMSEEAFLELGRFAFTCYLRDNIHISGKEMVLRDKRGMYLF